MVSSFSTFLVKLNLNSLQLISGTFLSRRNFANMKQSELKEKISKLEINHATGKLMMMEIVNRLYDIERDHEFAPEEIATYISDEDIKDNYLDISRSKTKK